MRLGLLSDTHLPGAIDNLGDLGPEPAEFFSTVDLILHAGDVTAPSVLDWLEQFAPVVCATGNNDGLDDPRTKDVQMLEIEGWRIGMVHSLDREFRPVAELQEAFASPVDVMVSGHTHLEALALRDGVVMVNSGSITFPHQKDVRLGTAGLLELSPEGLHAEVFPVGQTPGRPNPGRAIALDVKRPGARNLARECEDSGEPPK